MFSILPVVAYNGQPIFIYFLLALVFPHLYTIVILHTSGTHGLPCHMKTLSSFTICSPLPPWLVMTWTGNCRVSAQQRFWIIPLSRWWCWVTSLASLVVGTMRESSIMAGSRCVGIVMHFGTKFYCTFYVCFSLLSRILIPVIGKGGVSISSIVMLSSK